MQINILIFGQLTDIVQSSKLTFSGIVDTDGLIIKLNNLFPDLVNAKYLLAVDKKTIAGNTLLKEGSTIALLPPFSGG